MTVKTLSLNLDTDGNAHVINVTEATAKAVRASGLHSGIVTLFVPGATGALTTIEFEPGAVSDFQRLFDEIIPPNREYAHNAAYHDGNGHSHVRAALLGPSLTIPFNNSSLMLGTWQKIIFVDFDNRPRSRSLVAQVLGE